MGLTDLLKYSTLYLDLKTVVKKLRKRTKQNSKHIKKLQQHNLLLAQEVRFLHETISEIKSELSTLRMENVMNGARIINTNEKENKRNIEPPK